MTLRSIYAAVVLLMSALSIARSADPTKASADGQPSTTVERDDGQPNNKAPLDALNDLPDRWRNAMKSLHVPGMAVVVVHGDEVILLETLGVRDPERGLPVTKDTYFYVASITKAFTGLALLDMARAGLIELDAPVKKYLPRFELTDRTATEQITVRELLSHAAGISEYGIVYLDAYTGEITEDRFYRHLRGIAASREFQYSNIHYTLIGRVIESIRGDSWQREIKDRVVRPAGLSRTTCTASAMFNDEDVAIPCVFQNDGFRPARTRKTDRTMHAAGGMGASIEDMARWLRMIINRGSIGGTQVIDPAIIDQMTSVQSTRERSRSPIPNAVRTGYGVGWNIGEYRNRRILEHGGGYVGCSAHLAILQDERIGVATLANVESALPFVAICDVIDRLLGEEANDLLPRLAQATERREAQAEKRLNDIGPNPGQASGSLSLPVIAYAGLYENSDWGSVVVAINAGEMVLRTGDMSWAVGSVTVDRISLLSEAGSQMEAQFVIEKERVLAVEIEFDEGSRVQFAKND